MKVYTETIRCRVWRWNLRKAVASGCRHVPDIWGFVLPIIEEDFSFSDEDLIAEFGPIPQIKV